MIPTSLLQAASHGDAADHLSFGLDLRAAAAQAGRQHHRRQQEQRQEKAPLRTGLMTGAPA